jgi:hypothetical protein
MPTYIAQAGSPPVPLDNLRTLASAYSFPPQELTTLSDYASIVTAIGYAECTITNAVSDITPAFNQSVQLGNAASVGGNLQAAYVAASLTGELLTDALADHKEDRKAQIKGDSYSRQRDATNFAKSSGGANISLRYDDETRGYLTQVLVVAQNANTGATVKDAAGSNVTLSLAELKFVMAGCISTNQSLVEARNKAVIDIDAATTSSAVDAVKNTFTTSYPPPSGS